MFPNAILHRSMSFPWCAKPSDERFPGRDAREEGLRILTSPRREASLFNLAGNRGWRCAAAVLPEILHLERHLRPDQCDGSLATGLADLLQRLEEAAPPEGLALPGFSPSVRRCFAASAAAS